MGAVLQTNCGKIKYSDDFIASIAGVSATECYGVVGMTPKKVWDNFAELLGKDNLKKGVKIITDETNSIKIELNIVIEYGISMAAAGSSIIHTVKYNVEKTTGLTVDSVNVVISGVRIQN